MKRKTGLLHHPDDKRRFAVLVLHNLLLLLLGGVAVVLACAPGMHVGGVSLLGGLPLLVIHAATLHHLSPLRRKKTHPLSIFLIGLFQDLLSGGTIGLWASLYLLLHAMLLTQPYALLRFIERSALLSWLGFLLVSCLFALLCRFAGWLVLGSTLPLSGLALQWCVTALLYPAVLLLRRRPSPAAVPARGGGGE